MDNDVQVIKECLKIRESILRMVYCSQSGHIGGSFSATELLYILYQEFLRYDAKRPLWEERDYFVLSKGHATPLYYSILAHFGYFDVEWLDSFRQLHSPLQGHPDASHIPGVEVSTGSLGQGFGMAGGIALGLKKKNFPNCVVALLGDGEIQEGNIWEAAMAMSHFSLSHLLAIVDHNGVQLDGQVENIMNVLPIDRKFEAFGFESVNINGHDIQEIRQAYRYFYDTVDTRKKPMVIVARTIKGKGVSFMEGNYQWHGKAPTEEQFHKAMSELNK